MPDGPPGQCQLLGGPSAWLAQGILGLLAFVVLLYKRHKERPQRPLQVWGMDVSKQILSMLVAHICGMAIAMAASGADHKIVSDCAWYFVAFAFDTTLGVALAIGLHNLALHMAGRHANHSSIAACIRECGNYGNPPRWSNFWPQALEWVGVVILARFLCGAVVLLLRRGLIHVARILDVLFDSRPLALLYFVMICCPLLMNLLQALIQDMVLMWRKEHMNGASGADQDNNLEAVRWTSHQANTSHGWSV